ncbi:MAG: MFS transporter [Haloferacaceae archaeon]
MDGSRAAYGRLSAPFSGRGGLLWAVAAGWLAVLGMRFVLPALLPQVRAAFDLGNTGAGAVVSVVWATYAVMQFPAGALVDRIGERRLLAGSTLAAATGVGVIAVAPSLLPFVLGCAVFGLGTGLFGPPRATVLSRAFGENDGAAFGVVLGAGSVGAALLPAGATYLAARAGWRVAFALAVPAYLLLGAALWFAVPPRERTAAGRALRADAGRVGREVRRRPVVIGVLGIGLMLFVFQGLSAFLPTYLVSVKGLAATTAGTLFALLFLVGAAAQSAAGRLADRLGHGRVLVATTAASVLPLAVLPLVEGVAALAVVSAAMGVRLAVAPVSNAYIVEVLADDVEGTAWGLLRTGFFVVGSTGSVAVGYLADSGLFDAAFLGLAGLTVVAALCYARLPDREAASASGAG